MANKLDTEKKLFMGPTACREGSVADAIRQAVRDLDQGEGVTYTELESHMLSSFKPKKSGNYNASFVKSYVRDGVNRYGHLSYANEGHDYQSLAAAEPRAPRSGGSSRGPSRAKQEQSELLQFVRDQANIADQSELDAKFVTSDDMVAASGRQAKTINAMVDKLETAGLVRTESVAGTVEGDTVRNVYLTSAGYLQANEAAPQGAGSDEEQERQDNAEEAVSESQPS